MLFYNKFDLTNICGENKVSGQLVGGCVSVLAHDLATKNQVNWGGEILLLEDIEEKGEKLDRVFSQFLKIMVENNSFPKAILFGNFIQFIEDQNLIKNIEIAIKKFVQNINEKTLNITIFIENNGFIGHGNAILPLIIGRKIILEDKILLQK